MDTVKRRAKSVCSSVDIDALLFSNEPSGSFTCPVYNTDTRDLDLMSHPNSLVRQGNEPTTPGKHRTRVLVLSKLKK